MKTPHLALLLCFGVGACGDDATHVDAADAADATAADTADATTADDAPDADGATAPDAAPDVDTTPSDPGSFRWDLSAVGPSDFFAYPWPSERRVNARGAPDMTAFRTDLAVVDLLDKALRAVEAGSPGYSPLSSAYFGLTVGIVQSSLDEDGAVMLVDLDRGVRLAAHAEFNADGGGYWPPLTLAIHPDYQLPPPTATRVAAIITTKVHAVGGAPLHAPTGPDADAARDAVRPALPALGLTDEDVVAASVWRTSDPMADLRALADWVRAEPVPAATEWAYIGSSDGYDKYQGKLAIVEGFSGEPPYTAEFGEGLIALDTDGGPATPHTMLVPVTLTVPPGAPPESGFPIVLYGHGLGEDHEGFLRTAATPLANRGVAVIGLDPPLQGARNPTPIADRDLIVQLSIGNILGGREILRQGTFDYMQLARLVADPAFAIPAAAAKDGVALSFDESAVGFMGHSEGAQIGALLLPLEPLIGPGVLSEGGGGAAITMLALKLQELDVAATVAQVLGVDKNVEAWALGHPIVSCAIQPLLDSADPLYLARELFRAPAAGSPPHDLVMLEGFLDALTPPASIEALASAAGLPIAQPVGRAIAGLDAQAIASTPLPAARNLPAVGGVTPTGALLQLPDADHYTIYFNQPVRKQLFDFLASALAGHAELDPLPATP
ncbi:MAG: hypothetical protein U1F43_06820 [Myxococcota bacterium]